MKRCNILLLIFCTCFGLAAWPQEQAQMSPGDPGKPGQYAVGHTGYLLSDANRGNRPVYFMVWYPVDPSTIGPSTPTAQYPFDPYTGSTYVPIMLSTDFEAVGYDAAYEAVPPSHRRDFPLVVFSPAHTVASFEFVSTTMRNPLSLRETRLPGTSGKGGKVLSWEWCMQRLLKVGHPPLEQL